MRRFSEINQVKVGEFVLTYPEEIPYHGDTFYMPDWIEIPRCAEFPEPITPATLPTKREFKKITCNQLITIWKRIT